MRIFFFLTLIMLLPLAAVPALGQTPKDVTVPLSATVNTSPLGISLNWPMPSARNILILRRTKGQAPDEWIEVFSMNSSTTNTFTDITAVSLGETYEYVIQLNNNNLNAFGYAHVAVNAPVIHDRGKMILIVDGELTTPLAPEINRLKSDLVGDGWQLIEHISTASSTVQSIKSQIVADYNADPENVKSVFILGAVPIPYSGDAAWDGHPEHAGAWPSDAYYADVDGIWTDNLINNVTPARDANDNVPGDGKFDDSLIPSPVELMVGRVDFRRIDAAAFGVANKTELYRRYLNKDHAWRSGAYKVENQALVDDNFGYFNGEAFAANGFRNAYPLVGEANIKDADFFVDSKSKRWLMGYGTGPGSYTSAGGVGNSTNFATDTVNIVFSNLFGSYHGDWDYESDPFMVAALASRGGILNCSWAGRPHHFYHALASGESIGYAMKETMNAPYNLGFYGSIGEAGAHIALLGDPSIRAQVVQGPTALTAASTKCTEVKLAWSAAPDNPAGYHVYRSLSPYGPYTRLTSTMLTATEYVDNDAAFDTLYYQVRAIKAQNSPAGGVYMNNSTGVFASIINTSAALPNISAQGGNLTCTSPNLNLEGNSTTAGVSYKWAGPGGFSSNEQNPLVAIAGVYTLTVTSAVGCTVSQTATVTEDKSLPTISFNNYGLNCNILCAKVPLPKLTNIVYYYRGLLVSDSLELCEPGLANITYQNTENGCTASRDINIVQDIVPPGASATVTGDFEVDCISPEVLVVLKGNSPTNGVTYLWVGPNGFSSDKKEAETSLSGPYFLTVTNPVNGCTSTAQVDVVFKNDFNDPVITMEGNKKLTCLVTTTKICAESVPVGSIFKWTGPNNFVSSIKCPNMTLPGIYTVTVTAANGCSSTSSVEVEADEDVPSLLIDGNPRITCDNPKASMCASSTTPGVTYNWLQNNQSITTDSCLVSDQPGNYTCIITAPNGCTISDNIDLLLDTQIPDIKLPAVLPVLNCKNPCVTVIATSTTPDVDIQPLNACLPGSYTIEVFNPANGCQNSVAVNIEKRAELKAAPVAIISDCNGPTKISIKIEGGLPPYQYLWSNGATTDTISIPQGSSITIGLTVTDADSCSLIIPGTTIVSAAPISSSAVVLNESAPGAKDGSITTTVIGGANPYSYLWSNGASTPSISQLAGGIYTLTITDANGCTQVLTAQVKTTIATHEADWIGSLQLSPNPTNGAALLEIQLLQAEALRLRVHDAAGRLVWELAADAAATINQIIDLQNYAAGVYHLSIQSRDRVATRKLVLMK